MKRFGILLCLALAACGERQDYSKPIQVKEGDRYDEKAPTNTRFTVQRVGTFKDDLSYTGARGIYVLTDNRTGREYVGVSGVGISELGSHAQRSGKTSTTVSDER